MSRKPSQNARDDNERTDDPSDDRAGVTGHLINRDTTTDPPSRQVSRVGDPSNNSGVVSDNEDDDGGEPVTPTGGADTND